jgi:anti-anti-sigma factor
MKITERTVSNVLVLDLDGKLAMGEGDLEFREHIMKVLESGQKNILLNFNKVSRLDSSGLGEMVRAITTCLRYEAKLKVCAVPSRIMDLLQSVRLSGALNVHPDEASALASF